jgi:hypothetical protein
MKTIINFLTSDAFGFVLKIFSGLAASGFGMLGIGTKTRNDDGSLTRNGWIALVGIVVAGILALGTSLYEFTTSQEKTKAAQAQSQQLILSVRRGIYPLKGITASFDIYFDQDIAGLTEYKKTVRAAISDNPNCEIAKTFSCWGQSVNGPYAFLIPSTSPLFPKSRSIVRIVIDNLSANISMYKRLPSKSPNETPGYKYLGIFSIHWWNHSPEEWALEYDYPRDNLSVHVESIEVPDSSPVQSRVYSLVDFIPGLVVASADFSDDWLCDTLKRVGFRNCGDRIIEPLSRHLRLDRIQLRFKYPKSIYFPQNSVLTCADRQYPSLFIFKDIDSASYLGALDNEITSADKAKACEAITNPERTAEP